MSFPPSEGHHSCNLTRFFARVCGATDKNLIILKVHVLFYKNITKRTENKAVNTAQPYFCLNDVTDLLQTVAYLHIQLIGYFHLESLHLILIPSAGSYSALYFYLIVSYDMISSSSVLGCLILLSWAIMPNIYFLFSCFN